MSSRERCFVGVVMWAARFFLVQSWGRIGRPRRQLIGYSQKVSCLIRVSRAGENWTPPIRSLWHLCSAWSMHLVRRVSMASASSVWAGVSDVL